MRFQYDPPAQLLVVADGRVVAVRDNELRTTERTPLRSTPLNIILGQNIDLERNARVLRVSRSGPWDLITVRDRAGQMDGQITLQFNNGQLRSWDVIDATGARTRVSTPAFSACLTWSSAAERAGGARRGAPLPKILVRQELSLQRP
jgi:outer membrane lipoprotein-sorting protein